MPVRGRLCKGLAEMVWGPAGLSPDAFGLRHDSASTRAHRSADAQALFWNISFFLFNFSF